MIPRIHLRVACTYLLLVILSSGALPAQQQPYRRYGLIDGLSNLNVRCLFEDRLGYIWIGTDNGLFRYDGGSFKEYNHDLGLPSTEIEGLAESPDGVLWVATQEGVARSSGTRFQVVEVGQKGTFSTIAFDALGRMLLQSTSGIRRGIPDGAGSYTFQPIVHGVTHGLLIAGQDVVFGKDDRLWQLKGDQPEPSGLSDGLPADHWDAISMDTAQPMGS